MSTLRPILSNALNPILQGLRGSVSRFFTEFDSVAQSYIKTVNLVDTSGNIITISVAFMFKGGSPLSNLIGMDTGDPSEELGLRIQDGGFCKFYSSGFTPGIGSTNVDDGKLHLASVELNKTTGDFTVFLDGVVEYTGVHQGLARLKNSYYASVGASVDTSLNTAQSFLSGVVADAKITSDSTTVLDMPIDQNYTPTNNTVIDLASGNNGTFVNVADGDSTNYTLNADGNWVDSLGNVLEVAY